MQYWDDIITAQSFERLLELNQKYRFVLIGGWAVYFYSKALKSRDIDIVVDFETLAKMKHDFHVNKNERLKKYEIKEQNFDVDIYVEHYSNPGIPAEEILHQSVEKEGMRVPPIEMLVIIKQKVYRVRQGTVKGEKDKLDIISLLQNEVNWEQYKNLLSRYKLSALQDDLVEMLRNMTQAQEIGLNNQKFAQFKKHVLPKLAV